jgi:hypothetical protein
MAGYYKNSMSNNAVEAYAEGKKPVSRITNEDILKYGVNEGITFFRWYVQNYCPTCVWHHTSPKFNETDFYDIEDCCSEFKKADVEELRKEYKSKIKPKLDTKKDDEPYFAKIKYSISTFKGPRKHFEEYAVIDNCWAYVNDDYKKCIIKKNINGKHFSMVEKYQSRPKEMSEDAADSIFAAIRPLPKTQPSVEGK